MKFTGLDIFTNKQHEGSFGIEDDVPFLKFRKETHVCREISDDGLLLLEDGDKTFSLPTEEHLENVVENIKAILEAGEKKCLITVQFWGDRQEQVIGAKEG